MIVPQKIELELFYSLEYFMKIWIHHPLFSKISKSSLSDERKIYYTTISNYVLEFDDFLRALSVTARGTKQQRSEYLFYLYDIDHSGEITIEEFSNLLKLRLRKIELTNLEEIFKKIDTNGNGNVDFEEFVKACSTNNTLIEYLDLY